MGKIKTKKVLLTSGLHIFESKNLQFQKKKLQN